MHMKLLKAHQFARQILATVTAAFFTWALMLLIAPAPARAQGFTLPITTTAATNVNGLWWNPAESGWGVTFTQQANIIFVTLFTYDANGQARWYVASDCRVSGNGCAGDFYAVTGGSSPVVPWSPTLAVARVGVFTASFADVNNGSVSYSINGVNGSKAVTRQIWTAAGAPQSGITWENPLI